MKVNEHFTHVRSSILMQQPLPLVSHAYRLLAQEEKHKEIIDQSASSTDHMAFNVQRSFSLRSYSANRTSKGNNQQKFNGSSGSNQRYNSGNFDNQQRYNNKRPSSSYYCTHCKIHGHSNSRCFELHGYPPGFKGFKNKNVAALAQQSTDLQDPSDNVKNATIPMEEYKYLLQCMHKQETPHTQSTSSDTLHSVHLAGKICLLSCMKSSLILDSGATNHFCSDLNFFDEWQSVDGNENFITIPNGTKIPVKHVGTVNLSDKLKLLNVLYAPDFEFNLISVHKLSTNLDCTITFSGDKCFLQAQKLR